jgi:hypothetical protein
MYLAEAKQRLCSVKHDAVPLEIRRRELLELAALVGAALVLQAFVLPPLRVGPAWPHAVLLVALPWGAAWTLRRTAARPALAAAAVLSVGLFGAVLLNDPQSWARELTTNAYVSMSMVWILCSDRRTSAGVAAFGAAIMAVAFGIASLI